MGSSPHTRGAQVRAELPAERRGIIPAYAGSTRVGVSWTDRRRDHPRIRGEHRSPRKCASSCPRIIPAYAGSTHRRLGPAEPKSDHPRIRGEHRGGDIQVPRPSGSSPHTRGALRHPPRADRRLRIIPAYAGSTLGSVGSWKFRLDHPRIRGEHFLMMV